MKMPWAARVLCLVLAVSIVVVCGCASAFTPERKRRREIVVKTDMEHLIDDVDWILGFHRPVRSFDETMR